MADCKKQQHMRTYTAYDLYALLATLIREGIYGPVSGISFKEDIAHLRAWLAYSLLFPLGSFEA
jgi:hypothetical protein